MRKFDFYEFTATLIPGVVLLFGFTRILPDAWGRAHAPEATASEFTLFVLLSYAAGFIIQSFGNLIEGPVWRCFNDEGKYRFPWRGRPFFISFAKHAEESPINRFRRNHLILLTDEQFVVFKAKMKSELDFDWADRFKAIEKSQWTAIHRQIHAALKKNKLSSRCDLFAAGYAMARGLLASFIALFFIYLGACGVADDVYFSWWIFAFFLLAIDSAFMRMNLYGTYVARETYVQFLTIK